MADPLGPTIRGLMAAAHAIGFVLGHVAAGAGLLLVMPLWFAVVCFDQAARVCGRTLNAIKLPGPHDGP